MYGHGQTMDNQRTHILGYHLTILYHALQVQLHRFRNITYRLFQTVAKGMTAFQSWHVGMIATIVRL